MKGNRKEILYKSIIVVLLTLFHTFAQGQNTHVVKAGETLFSISRQYGVTVAVLEQANNISAGTAAIQIGQKLTIPQGINGTNSTNGIAGSNCREMHRVQKNETLYSIAQHYGVTVEMLQAANPELKGDNHKLKKGDFLCVPFSVAEKKQNIKLQESGLQQIRIGLLLPFKGNAVESRQAKEFYQGFLLAVDSLQRQGASIEVIAMNLANKTDMPKIEQNMMLRQAHLLFSPFDTALVHLTANYAKRYKIATVVPYTSQVKDIATNPYLYMLNPPSQLKDEFAITALLSYFASQRFVFFEYPNGDEQAFITRLKNELKKRSRGYTEIHQGSDNKAIKEELEKYINAIVLPNASDEVSLKLFLQRMKGIKNTYGTPFTLLGYPQWQLYASLYAKTMNELDTYIYTPFYTSSADTKTKSYNTLFASAYGTTPTQTIPNSSMMGYDAGLYFMSMLYKYGIPLANKDLKMEGVQSNFSFVPYSPNGGFVNNHIRLVHYY